MEDSPLTLQAVLRQTGDWVRVNPFFLQLVTRCCQLYFLGANMNISDSRGSGSGSSSGGKPEWDFPASSSSLSSSSLSVTHALNATSKDATPYGSKFPKLFYYV
jgi:hypothetical protein